ncbi:MAG: hypothetical protein A2516_09970 [Alphaproteobacteria bacterium RIFOXYD12_FULL_60_8]|nr:MAG: hypothetical protein A2516_09970 [Alphaproteobacteria bacterium RIFOXYD12_FULL_60_8]
MLVETLSAYRRHGKQFVAPMGVYVLAFAGYLAVMNAVAPDFPTPYETAPATPDAGRVLVLLGAGLVFWLMAAMVTVRLMRIVLFENPPEGQARGLRLGRIEFRFLGYSLLLALGLLAGELLCVLAVVTLGMVFGVDLSPQGIPDPWFSHLIDAAIVGYLLLASWVVSRILFVGPAVAAEAPGGFLATVKVSWRATKGHVWEMSWTGLVPVLAISLFGALPLILSQSIPALVASAILMFVLNLLLYPFLMAWVALAYLQYVVPSAD